MIIDTMTQVANHMVSGDMLHLYPNPAKDYIYIYNSILDSKQFDIQILNLKGQQLNSYRNKKTIPVSHLSAGQYIIRIRTKQFIFTTKWLKLPD